MISVNTSRIARTNAIARPLQAVVAALLIGMAIIAAAIADPVPPTDALKPGEFVWAPDIAPRGPLAIVISLPAQRAYVYRNGVRIGISTVSSGMTGRETPSGIYTILQKQREHYSNLYDDAPMPFMQRLTWDGVAMHAGKLPGYPASHGCVRLPAKFAELLYAVTTPGTPVVIAAADTSPPTLTSPGLFAPVDAHTGEPTFHDAPVDRYTWMPYLSPEGPLTILVSVHDRHMLVLRNAVAIGHADIDLGDVPVHGTRAYMLLEGTRPEPSPLVPGRPALRWMDIPVSGQPPPEGDPLRAAVASGRVSLPSEFARLLYDALKPGTTVVLTDEPLQPQTPAVTVMSSDTIEPHP